MLTLYHGSAQIVDRPEIRTHKYQKDFIGDSIVHGLRRRLYAGPQDAAG